MDAGSDPPRTADVLLGESVLGLAVLARVREVLRTPHRDVVERTTRSQVSFRRRRGFAYLWLPGRYLRNPAAEAVLSLATARPIASARFKEVVHPATTTWMHHLEIRSIDDLDDEVVGWLVDAADGAG